MGYRIAERITASNPKPLDIIDKILFKRWAEKMKRAILGPNPLSVPSWPEYRRGAI